MATLKRSKRLSAISFQLSVLTMMAGLGLAQKSYTPVKTPWGDPDHQGTWTSDDTWGVPMERPAQYGDRRYLTEQELAAREKQVQQTQERLLNPGDNHSPAKAQLDAITAGKGRAARGGRFRTRCGRGAGSGPLGGGSAPRV